MNMNNFFLDIFTKIEQDRTGQDSSIIYSLMGTFQKEEIKKEKKKREKKILTRGSLHFIIKSTISQERFNFSIIREKKGGKTKNALIQNLD